MIYFILKKYIFINSINVYRRLEQNEITEIPSKAFVAHKRLRRM